MEPAAQSKRGLVVFLNTRWSTRAQASVVTVNDRVSTARNCFLAELYLKNCATTSGVRARHD
jgi:hypothetical protein